MGPTRVVLADDSPEILARVVEMLRGDFDIAGTARNGEEAIDAVARLNPHAVVLDISMPVLNGIQAASRLREAQCTTKVIFLTVHEDQDYLEAAIAAGAYGYVLKSRMVSDLIPAIQAALQGQRFRSAFPQASTTRGGHRCEQNAFFFAASETER